MFVYMNEYRGPHQGVRIQLTIWTINGKWLICIPLFDLLLRILKESYKRFREIESSKVRPSFVFMINMHMGLNKVG